MIRVIIGRGIHLLEAMLRQQDRNNKPLPLNLYPFVADLTQFLLDLLNKSENNLLYLHLLSKCIAMKSQSLGEFEELVLLTVAAQHDTAYGVSIKESLEKVLDK